MDYPFDHMGPGAPVPALILVVSGPSGVGKTVACQRLLSLDPTLRRSVSATTRPIRSGETDGDAYLFWDEARFRAETEVGGFLEWAEVHDHLYGTPSRPIDAMVSQGITPVLNIDVQGGHAVKRLRPDAVLVFLTPPSLEVLEQRLRDRGTESEEVIQLRLANARRELEEWSRYDYLVLNDDLDRAVTAIREIVAAERRRPERLRPGRP